MASRIRRPRAAPSVGEERLQHRRECGHGRASVTSCCAVPSMRACMAEQFPVDDHKVALPPPGGVAAQRGRGLMREHPARREFVDRVERVG